MDAPLLQVETLQTHFGTPDGVVRAVDGLSFRIGAGETVALVGESGCGKSVTSMSILRLIAEPPGRIAGNILFRGRDLLALSEREMRRVRGKEISMIFQEPMTSLNPVLTVGWQIGETLRLHEGLSARAAEARAVEMLTLVGLPAPDRQVRAYPHQLSGGMRQRVMIAMAVACNPRLLIADEPTTALDVTIQAQILDLMRGLKARLGSAILLITHDLGVVAEMAQRVVVMYAGRCVEEASVEAIFARPMHPYTRGLLGAVPRLGSVADAGRAQQAHRNFRAGAQPARAGPWLRFRRALRPGERPVPRGGAVGRGKAPGPFRRLPPRRGLRGTGRMSAAKLLEVSDLTKHFAVSGGLFGRMRGIVHAADGVSFDIARGETLSLVGESGCGKSTVGKAILRLFPLTAGEVRLDGQRIDNLPAHRLRPLRRRIQIVFQDPFSSINPRLRVRDIIAEPIVNFAVARGRELDDRVAALIGQGAAAARCHAPLPA